MDTTATPEDGAPPLSKEPINQELYQEFLKLRDAARKIRWGKLEPLARQIIWALNRDKDVMNLRFTESSIVYETDSFGVSIPVELLWDNDWEGKVQKILEERRRKYEERARQGAAAEKARVEKTERAQLAQLLEKYPDMVKPREK